MIEDEQVQIVRETSKQRPVLCTVRQDRGGCAGGFEGGEGQCLKCGSRVSFADVTDTVLFVGEEIVRRYNGDITNRNCVRCQYPEQYPEYEDHDRRDSPADNDGYGIREMVASTYWAT